MFNQWMASITLLKRILPKIKNSVINLLILMLYQRKTQKCEILFYTITMNRDWIRFEATINVSSKWFIQLVHYIPLYKSFEVI